MDAGEVDGHAEDLAAGAEPGEDRFGEDVAGRRHHEVDDGDQHQRMHADPQTGVAVAGAVGPGDERGRAGAQPEGDGHPRKRQGEDEAERRELGDAEHPRPDEVGDRGDEQGAQADRRRNGEPRQVTAHGADGEIDTGAGRRELGVGGVRHGYRTAFRRRHGGAPEGKGAGLGRHPIREDSPKAAVERDSRVLHVQAPGPLEMKPQAIGGGTESYTGM